MASLRFALGTLEVGGLDKGVTTLPPACAWDERTACFRAPASAYADVVRALVHAKVPFEDEARGYEELPRGACVHMDPRPYQREALAAWKAARGRGVVVLPTGAGKTHVAMMAIDAKRRSTLVVAPTLDLVRQWYDLLRVTFGVEVGVVGGGEHVVRPLTVTTYDSAYIHAEHLGRRFGMVVFDECHHLPGPSHAIAARAFLAPFRLGLTATPERPDGRDAELDELVGPMVYRRDIVDLSGDYLAEYETVRITVDLSPEEREEHDAERALYRAFLGAQGIRMSSPSGFRDFIARSARTPEGRRAMKAYRRQRQIALAANAKMSYLDHILTAHRADRTIVFTQDNATAYSIARRFLLPVITHQTKVSERSEVLAGLGSAKYGAIVTSKVLNEGVDVREANVAIVVSGSGSVREHVQRLGRILRKSGEKRALLYELVTQNTTETYTSERRREHDAYR
ncbi:MAG: DEAD/DEAH box helicase family protein [Myxococcales bacterium]|nr:DEAD/DEAH box helicase family protein [Myxococcales bacterium]